jgi:hypothetical protein
VQMQLGLGQAADEGFDFGHDFKFTGWWFFPTLDHPSDEDLSPGTPMPQKQRRAEGGAPKFRGW